MMETLLTDIPLITPDDDFEITKDCIYKEEHYSVRDNGAVYRHAREGKIKRKDDNKWTFGQKSNTNGYMLIGSHRVHIIVATAFHGANDSSKLVVDHIDTNRCNNRPENLRWLTRLENALNNPATRKRIEFLCGDIQKFLDDPSCLRDITGSNQDIMWMRTVSKEEARASFERIMSWGAKPNRETASAGGKLGEWVFTKSNSKATKDYSKQNLSNTDFQNIPQITVDSDFWGKETFILSDSPTPNAKQGNWHTLTEFLCCPRQISDTPVEDYFCNLEENAVYTRNQYGETKIVDFALSEDKKHLWVLSFQEGAIKPWAVSEIILHENTFIHLNRYTYFQEDGGRKYYILSQGKEWTGGDVFDDGIM